MPCPCCGGQLHATARECACGARFVGEPLDPMPIKVQKLGPVMAAVLVLILVTAAALVVSKILAALAVVVAWLARRAVRLARRDPENYGGYRTALATLILTTVAGTLAAGYGVSYIPRMIKDGRTKKLAATQATMYHIANLLEEYKLKYGSYPSNLRELQKAAGDLVPEDFWQKTIAYRSYTSALVNEHMVSIPFNNFELRSAGPDNREGTEDDIVMRDGVFLTSLEVKRQPVGHNTR